MATHSSTLAWRIPWMEEPDTVHGVAKSQTRLSDFTYLLTKFRTNYNSLKLINHLISLSGSFKQSVFIVKANVSIKVQLCGLFQNSQRV